MNAFKLAESIMMCDDFELVLLFEVNNITDAEIIGKIAVGDQGSECDGYLQENLEFLCGEIDEALSWKRTKSKFCKYTKIGKKTFMCITR